MIFKLQKPLASHQANPPVLAYSEGRQNIMDIPLTPHIERLFGPHLKIYVEATIVGRNLRIDSLVPDRRW
jgi:hypothetical protein